MNYTKSLSLLCLLMAFSSAVIINEEATEAIKKILEKFILSPTSATFRNVQVPSQQEFPFPIRYLIYSPIEQYGFALRCPLHKTQLRLSGWTDNLSNSPNRYNPRLICCLSFNILLIQRYYKCDLCNKEIPSISKDIFDMLPSFNAMMFPYRIYRRRIYSAILIDFIFEQVTHGQNFRSISETVANMHYSDFVRISGLFPISINFFTSPLTHYPTNDKLKVIFLDIFQEREIYYKQELTSREPIRCLTADHTFRVGKNIGGYRKEDKKFTREGCKLFILLDAHHYVIDWKLTKSCKFSDVKDILENVKKRMALSQLEYIVLDNCCTMANKYNEAFPGIPIKLDLFHCVQRLTKCLVKCNRVNIS